MIFDEPWPLPVAWRWQRFDAVARVASNLVDPKDFPDWPHIAPNHIESETGRLLPFKTIAEDGVVSSKQRFSSGQVLYSKIRPYLAKVVVAGFDGLCSADMYPIESELEPRFLQLWMLTREFTRRAAGQQARTVLPKINVRGLSTMPIPVPPLIEQRRIVEILDDHLSRLNAARRYLEGVELKASVMQGAILQAAIVSGGKSRPPQLMNVQEAVHALRRAACPPEMKRGRPRPTPPANDFAPWSDVWPTFSLEELTDPVRTISYGILKPGPNIEGGVPYVRVLNMRGNRLDVPALHCTTRVIADKYARASLAPRDVLVSIRGTYGRVVEVPDSLAGANITQDTARLAFLPVVKPEFATLVLRSPFIQQYMTRVARGVAVKGVNIADLRSIPFPLPPIVDQEAILERVESLTSELLAAWSIAESGLRRGRALRQSLLNAAFSGRLTATMDLAGKEEHVGV